VLEPQKPPCVTSFCPQFPLIPFLPPNSVPFRSVSFSSCRPFGYRRQNVAYLQAHTFHLNVWSGRMYAGIVGRLPRMPPAPFSKTLPWIAGVQRRNFYFTSPEMNFSSLHSETSSAAAYNSWRFAIYLWLLVLFSSLMQCVAYK